MSLKISRDANGNVTITNPQTGKTEIVHTAVSDRPAEVQLGDDSALPSHHWAALPSHHWAVLPSHHWSNLD